MKIAQRVSYKRASPPLDIGLRVKEIKAEGGFVIDFGVGEPDFETPDDIKEAGIEAIKGGFTRYPPTAGFSDLRLAICRKLKEENGLDYVPEQVVVTCGAKHALYNIFQVLCEPGDEVIIPSPYWMSYPHMVRFAGATPVIIHTTVRSGFKLTARQFEEAITSKTRAVIINSPSNPTGAVYSRDELMRIAEIAVSRQIYIVSDEIYEKLVYDGLNYCSVAALGEEAYDFTITVNGFSKSHAMTGWRIGYLAAPREIAQAVTFLQGNSTSGACSISQKAAIAALKTDKKELKYMVNEFSRRRDYMVAELNKMEKISWLKPSGAFYVFCDISRSGLGSVDFSRQLFEQYRVAVFPGVVFGWDSHIRISFANSMDNIREGLSYLRNFLQGL